MNKEDLNGFIDYKGAYYAIKESHLKNFPTKELYCSEYLCEPYDKLTETEQKEVNELYSFLFTPCHDEFIKSIETCYETSTINVDKDELTIAFVIDNSTNTESGYNADYCLYVFEVDVDIECFAKYWTEQ